MILHFQQAPRCGWSLYGGRGNGFKLDQHYLEACQKGKF